MQRSIELPPPAGDEDPFEAFAAKHLYVRTERKELVPLRLRPLQREFHRDFTGRDIVDKARKHGISTYYAARFYWHVTTERNVGAAMVAHKPDSTEMLWQIVQLFRDMDPRVRSGQLTFRYDSRRELYVNELGSWFRVYTAGKGSGRGGTPNYLHVSELAWWDKDAAQTLAGLEASIPGPEFGTEIGIESTANGEGNAYHQRFVAAWRGDSEYQAHFFPWHAHPLYVADWKPEWGQPTSDERALAMIHGLSREQLAYRRGRVATMGEDLFRQEYPFTWQESFLASGRPAFSQEALLKLEARDARAPMQETREGESYARIWQGPREGRKYVAGIDMSEGVRGGDHQDLTILDAETLTEVASMNGLWPIHVFARKAAALVNSFGAFTAVEVNNHGHALLEHWLHGRDELHVDHDLLYHREDYDSDTGGRKPGWQTNEKTRDIMIAELEEFIRRGWVHFRDADFYPEARSFAYQEDGKPAAPAGMHDDRVISRALALQARKEALTTVGYTAERIFTGL